MRPQAPLTNTFTKICAPFKQALRKTRKTNVHLLYMKQMEKVNVFSYCRMPVHVANVQKERLPRRFGSRSFVRSMPRQVETYPAKCTNSQMIPIFFHKLFPFAF